MADDEQKPDFMLVGFTEAANKTDKSVDLSIIVNGIMLSGTLVGYKEYRREMVNLAKGHPFEIPVPDTDKNVKITEGYIHLKNVQPVLSGLKLEYQNFPYWRFKLSDISGWTLGVGTRTS